MFTFGGAAVLGLGALGVEVLATQPRVAAEHRDGECVEERGRGWRVDDADSRSRRSDATPHSREEVHHTHGPRQR